MKTTVFCLHGFLGQPSDWDFLKPPSDRFQIEKVDVFRTLAPSLENSMAEWARAFNEAIATRTERRVILGYSMGGRLALHSLARNPSLWDGAILVSANPGIPESEKPARLEADETWAHRFETEPWESVIDAWEKLPAFCGQRQSLSRHESDFRRSDLSGALRAWSVGRQDDLSSRLSSLSFPILWMTGELDRRYSDAAQALRARRGARPDEKPGSWEMVQVTGAAHRVPWERPEVFQENFSRFLLKNF